MQATTTVHGPLFEQPNLVAGLLRAGQEAGALIARQVRVNLSGGIVHRGPGRYGHLGDQWRYAVATGGEAVTTRVFPAGKAAFRALFLESGTVAHYIAPRRRRRRGSARGRALALHTRGGLLFRAFAHHPGTAAYHFLERTLDQTWPTARGLFEREVMREVSGGG